MTSTSTQSVAEIKANLKAAQAAAKEAREAAKAVREAAQAETSKMLAKVLRPLLAELPEVEFSTGSRGRQASGKVTIGKGENAQTFSVNIIVVDQASVTDEVKANRKAARAARAGSSEG